MIGRAPGRRRWVKPRRRQERAHGGNHETHTGVSHVRAFAEEDTKSVAVKGPAALQWVVIPATNQRGYREHP